MNGWNPLRHHSIHTHIAIAFSCLILCTTALLSYSTYKLSSDAVTHNSLEYTSQLIEQVKVNIQTYISNMESIAALAMRSNDLQRYLKQNEPAFVKPLMKKQVGQYFNSIVSSRNDISSILFISDRGDEIVSNREHADFNSIAQIKEQDWYKKVIGTDQAYISSSHVQRIFRDEYRWVVSISRELPATDDSIGGVLLVDLNYKLINNLCKQIELGKRGYVFIVDPTGDLVYHPQQQLVYSQLKSEQLDKVLQTWNGSMTLGEGSDKKIYTVDTTSFGWKIVSVTYPDELVGNKRQIQYTSALWGIICLIAALAISIVLSYALTKPLKKLEMNMKLAERGDFDIRVEIDNTNEIGKLARTFNIMISKIKELMNQVVEEQEMKRVSELKALQAQIQPHFLYNTLDSIIWMAEMGKMEEVVDMTSALSKLLRSTISKGDELIPISVELEHIHNYLTIQKMRYRKKFTYSIDVDEDIGNCQILKLVLQPIVENAIYHGMKHKPETGHIRITGKRVDDDIELQVIDDGIGMDSDQAGTLLERKVASKNGNGVGVVNVDHRVKLNFGAAYGLRFESELEEGMIVTLRIPLLRLEGDA
ncbi:sensor histidine kinase [Paenibacillus terrigena]|uniref:sensor histidine kinase n=1 Tax=Paenibacillus terrigena TaxID=369333 RepID=UPI0028D39A55|nr:sensor histidine kinase [Paenibacillus terrigena]